MNEMKNFNSITISEFIYKNSIIGMNFDSHLKTNHLTFFFLK